MIRNVGIQDTWAAIMDQTQTPHCWLIVSAKFEPLLDSGTDRIAHYDILSYLTEGLNQQTANWEWSKMRVQISLVVRFGNKSHQIKLNIWQWMYFHCLWVPIPPCISWKHYNYLPRRPSEHHCYCAIHWGDWWGVTWSLLTGFTFVQSLKLIRLYIHRDLLLHSANVETRQQAQTPLNNSED